MSSPERPADLPAVSGRGALRVSPALAAQLKASLAQDDAKAGLALSMAELQAILDETSLDDLDAYISKSVLLRELMNRMKDQALSLRVLQDDPQVAAALALAESVRQRTQALRPTDGPSTEHQLQVLKNIEEGTQAARLALIAVQGAEGAALIKAEAATLTGEAEALGEKHNAAVKRVRADMSGQLVVAEARRDGERDLVRTETERVRSVGEDMALLSEAQRKGAQRVQIANAIDDVRGDIARTKSGRVAQEELEEAEGALDNAKYIDRLLSRYIAHVGAGAGQLVTAVLSTIGFASMAEERTPVVWALSGASALAVSSGMFAMIEAHMKGGWSFRRNWLAGTAFVALAGVTAGANYGGAVSELRPNGVMVESWTPEDAKGTQFVADARTNLSGLNETTSASVATVVAAGNALVDETLGRGASGQYGFEKESIQKLAEYRARLDEEVKALAAANDCEGLEALDANYKAMMDRMEAERLANPSYAKSAFVVGGKYDWDASAHIEACEGTHPVSGRELASQIEDELGIIRDELAQGTLKDPSKVNPRVASLNQKIKALAAIVDIEEVELQKMDPLMYQAIKVLVDSTAHSIDNMLNDAENTVPYWPFGYLILSLAMDQIGMLFSMLVWVARGNLKKAREEYENYLTRVTEVQRKNGDERLKGLSSKPKTGDRVNE